MKTGQPNSFAWTKRSSWNSFKSSIYDTESFSAIYFLDYAIISCVGLGIPIFRVSVSSQVTKYFLYSSIFTFIAFIS